MKRSKEEEREYDYTLEFAKRMLQDEQHLCETRKASAIDFNEERATLTDTSCKTTDELKSSDSEGNGFNPAVVYTYRSLKHFSIPLGRRMQILTESFPYLHTRFFIFHKEFCQRYTSREF